MTYYASHPYAYICPIMKTGGGGPLSTGVQRNMFLTDAMPSNPDNTQYIPVINASTYPSVVVANKKSPTVGIHTCLKPFNGTSSGWCDANLLNSLINTDTSNNTDRFAFAFLDEYETRLYDWMRCERLDFSGQASGGPVAVMMGFKGRWGDEDAPYGTTLSGSGEVIPSAPAFTYTGQVPDAGQVTPSVNVNIIGLDAVKGFSLSLVRGQSAQYYYDGGNGPSDIISTMFSGVLTVDQEPGADQQIATTGTVVFQFNPGLTSATGRFKITCLVKRDNRYKPQVTTLGNVTTTFSLFDQAAGGNPATIVAY